MIWLQWCEGDQSADVIYHYKGHAQSVEELAVSPSRTKVSMDVCEHMRLGVCKCVYMGDVCG